MDFENLFFLIATPQLQDPNFDKTVVLMLNHDQQGALGLVINRPLQLNFKDFAKDQNMVCHADLADDNLHYGGPVQPEYGFIFHRQEQLDEKKQVSPQIFLSQSQESLKNLLESGAQPLKIILGYAGWEASQLETEMAQGAWLSAPFDETLFFNEDHEKVWETVVKNLGINPASLAPGWGVH